ncbi:hypothetical protein [Nonomuraea typhae]|uniref:Uncharacterized protein n=1 Tax=Nonomuraea typhae TaxID=2603600 RepID=A0ABW7YU27_9ACTN
MTHEESEVVAEMFIRVTLSFLLTPDSAVSLGSDEPAPVMSGIN